MKSTDPEDPADRRLAEALARLQRARKRPHRYEPKPIDVAALRKRTGMTQKQFALRLGFPVATLRHWERGDRKPHGAALVLLNVLARNRRAVMMALSTLPPPAPPTPAASAPSSSPRRSPSS